MSKGNNRSNKIELIKKLQQIKALADECLEDLGSLKTPAKHIDKRKKSEQAHETLKDDYVIAVVNKIKNCDETDSIETKVLDKSSMTGRILLPFYICYKYFPDQSLTTGDIEKITSDLRVKAKMSNTAKAIKASL